MKKISLACFSMICLIGLTGCSSPKTTTTTTEETSVHPMTGSSTTTTTTESTPVKATRF